jgi:hypothetical protein
MLLYHSFPGFLGGSRNSARFSDLKKSGLFDIYIDFGVQILLSILEHGFLLTPEDLIAPINPTTVNPIRSKKRKIARLKGEEATERVTVQRRTCFTLCTLGERLGGYGAFRDLSDLDVDEDTPNLSHADLFGAFSIGVDPIRSREMSKSSFAAWCQVRLLPQDTFLRLQENDLRTLKFLLHFSTP